MDDRPTGSCRCGHSREMHEHQRPGSDCIACTGSLQCARFRSGRTDSLGLVANLPPYAGAAAGRG
jgi:hypothetical protein